MKNKIISDFEKRTIGDIKKLPDFRAGDTVRIHYRIQEGDTKGKQKFRVQPFEGVVIRLKRGVTDGSFTVRKIAAGGIGVERVFPLYSPNIEKVDVIASGIVRRSRLYYLRALSGKAARIRSRYHGKRTLVEMPGADHVSEEPQVEAAAVEAPASEAKAEMKAETKG